MQVDPIFDEIPTEWQLTTLGEICKRGGGSVQTGPFGSQLHASDYVTSGVPVIMPVNIGENRVVRDGIAQIREADAQRLSRHRAMPGDIIYSRRGDVERRALIRQEEKEWLCGTGCLRIRLGDAGVDPVFASYYLGHPRVRDWIVRHAIGATLPNLNTSVMSAVPFVVPSLPEQRAIAHILGTLDDKIELNRRMSETLEAMARAIFKAWFVDATQAGLPKGWDEGKVEELLTLSRETVNPSNFPDETFDHYSIPSFDEELLPKTEAGEQIQSNKFLVPPSAVMISKLNPRIPRVWLPKVSARHRSVASTEFLVAIPRPGISREWLYALFSSEAFLDVFATLVTGTSGSHQRVKPDYLLAMDLDIPPKEPIAEYTALTKPLHERFALNLEESRTLAALRDTLLPKLITGELRVKDAGRFISEVG